MRKSNEDVVGICFLLMAVLTFSLSMIFIQDIIHKHEINSIFEKYDNEAKILIKKN